MKHLNLETLSGVIGGAATVYTGTITFTGSPTTSGCLKRNGLPC